MTEEGRPTPDEGSPEPDEGPPTPEPGTSASEPRPPQAPPPFVWETPESAAKAAALTPGSSTDRVMTSGDIFQRAVWIYRTGFLVLVAVAAVIQIPLAVVDFFLGQRIEDAFAPLASLGSQATADEVMTILQDALPAAIPAVLTIVVVSFLLSLFLSPALIATVARIHAAERPSVGDAYRTALWSAPVLFLGSIVQGLALAALFVAIVLAGVIFQAAGVGWVSVIASFGALVALGYVSIRLAVWSQAVVIERRGPLDALGRSWRLVKGSMWRTVGILFVTAVVSALAGAVFGTLGGIVGRALAAGWASIIGDVLAVLTVSWVPIVTTLLFFDLRARREGAVAMATPPPEASWPIAPAGP